MGEILADLEQEDKTLPANWWNRRPAVEIIKSCDMLDDEMLKRMSSNGCRGKLRAEQSRPISLGKD